MFRFLAKALIATGLLTGGLIAFHAPSAAGAMQSTFAPIGGPTSVPYGWVDFCQRYRGECQAPDLAATDIELTPKAMKEIERVNRWVNSNITPMSDMEHWGVIDQWDYPTDGKGDCEDYALLKRKLLIEEGLPRQALLMTVVQDLNNDGHAVLTVKTNKGDFVLDNMRDEVRPWTQSRYVWLERQDPRQR